MRHIHRLLFAGLFVVTLNLAACTPAAPEPTPLPAPTHTAAPSPTIMQPTPTTGISFEPALYRNDTAGFEFDYPAGWTVGPDEIYSRGGITAFTSWERPNDVLPEQTPPGETRLDVTVLLWDPRNDLDAFIDVRMTAWDASGIEVLSRQDLTLENGQAAVIFVTRGIDGAQGFFFFTTLSDRYLVLSGEGDLALLTAIASSVRISAGS